MQISPVEITPIKANSTHGPWRVSHGGNSSDQANSYPWVVVPIAKGDYSITFKIVGDNTVVFDDSAQGGPIWIQTGGKPNAPALDGHIDKVAVSDKGKTLTIVDKKADTTNEAPLKLHYQLNFKGGETVHKKLDPIILNDGGRTVTNYSFLQIAVTGIAVLLFVALCVVIYRKLSSRKAPQSAD